MAKGPLAQLSVVFDLDGTLIDSAPDIHATANCVMAEMGFAALTRPQVQAYVGKGVENLVTQLLRHHGHRADDAARARIIARFQAEYLTAHSLTQIYPGVQTALQSLADQGAALGLCTNKPLAPTRAILSHLDLARHFDVVLGGDSLPLRKPDPEHLHATLRAMGRSRAIFIGDSEVDADTAQAAQVPFLLYTQGYRKSPVAQIPHTAAFDDYITLPDLVARHS